MDPQRHRRRAAREPLWGSTRLLVLVLTLVVVLGALVGLAAARSPSREARPAPSSTAPPSTASGRAPTTAAPPSTSSPPDTTRPRPSTTTSPPPSSSVSSTSRAQRRVEPEKPILQQPRPAPSGVLDQMLSSFGGADSQQCDQETSHIDPSRLPGPTIAIGSDERPSFAVLEIAEPIQLCLWGFAAGDPITVTVLYPDGRVRSSLGYPPAAPPGKPPCTGPGCYSHVNWAAVPGDPLGDYQVTAVQGGLRATGTVRVVPTSVRRLLVVGNGIDEGQYQTFRRGATVPIVAAGYGPVRDVELFIYHTPERVLQRGGTELHLLTWVRLRADSRGEFMYGLRTAAGDPAGCYALDTRPRAQALAPVLEVYRPTHTTVLNDKDSAPLFCLS